MHEGHRSVGMHESLIHVRADHDRAISPNPTPGLPDNCCRSLVLRDKCILCTALPRRLPWLWHGRADHATAGTSQSSRMPCTRPFLLGQFTSMCTNAMRETCTVGHNSSTRSSSVLELTCFDKNDSWRCCSGCNDTSGWAEAGRVSDRWLIVQACNAGGV